jgi:dihydrofolate reductase
MRKVILQEFVSIDGLAAGPDDSVDFVRASNAGDQSVGRSQLALMDAADLILLGRKTYELFAGYWPNATEGEDKEFAAKINAMAKVVFSTTLDRAPWKNFDDALIVRTAPVEEVARLRRQPGKNILIWGSLSVAQQLSDASLVDEYRLVICPIVLGGGRPLFRDRHPPMEMRLLGAERKDRGSVELTYTRANAAGGETPSA